MLGVERRSRPPPVPCLPHLSALFCFVSLFIHFIRPPFAFIMGWILTEEYVGLKVFSGVGGEGKTPRLNARFTTRGCRPAAERETGRSSIHRASRRPRTSSSLLLPPSSSKHGKSRPPTAGALLRSIADATG